jgi:hypothetical protein
MAIFFNLIRNATMLTRSFFICCAALATQSFAAAPTSCPFTPAELKATLDVDFKEGKVGFESSFAGGKNLSCRYESKAWSLQVKQVVMTDPKQTQGWLNFLAGKKEPVAGDADGAIQQVDQGDLTSPNLHYIRQGDIVELRILGVGKTSPEFAALNKKLIGLRRLP